MEHVMLDLETAATSHNAAILSIGAVTFDPEAFIKGARVGEGISPPWEAAVDLDDCIRHGLEVSGATISWWLRQSDEARARITPPRRNSLRGALRAFRELYATGPEGSIVSRPTWSHGATFDIPIIMNAFRKAEVSSPFHWRDARDTRTLFHLAASERIDVDFSAIHQTGEPLVAHAAGHDAYRQAILVQQACLLLKGTR